MAAELTKQIRSIMREELECFATNELHRRLTAAIGVMTENFQRELIQQSLVLQGCTTWSSSTSIPQSTGVPSASPSNKTKYPELPLPAPIVMPTSPSNTTKKPERPLPAPIVTAETTVPPPLVSSPDRRVSVFASLEEVIHAENAENAALEEVLNDIEIPWRRKPQKTGGLKRSSTHVEGHRRGSTQERHAHVEYRRCSTRAKRASIGMGPLPSTAPLLAEDSLVRPARNFSERYARLSKRTSIQFGNNRCLDLLMQLLFSATFQYAIAAAIVLNATTIGLQADYMARNWTASIPWLFYASEAIFCVVFTFELVLRLLVYGREFFIGPEWAWNLFDTALVALQLVEEFYFLWNVNTNIRLHDYTSDTGILRVLRIFRIIRLFRVGSMLHVVGELRAVTVAIGRALRSLFYTVLLLLVCQYAASVAITLVVTNYKIMRDHKVSASLEKQYGTLDRSFLVLFEAIADGVEWRDLLDPLTDNISPWLALPFCLYIAFVTLALMNVITGICVDKSLQSGQEVKRRSLLHELRNILQTAVTTQSGEFTWSEFEAQLENHPLLFEAIDIDQDDAFELFHLLDTHQQGSIDAEEFVNGCLRLDGPAKAVDMAVFTEESRRLNRKMIEQAKFVNHSLEFIMKMIGQLATRQAESMRQAS